MATRPGRRTRSLGCARRHTTGKGSRGGPHCGRGRTGPGACDPWGLVRKRSSRRGPHRVSLGGGGVLQRRKFAWVAVLPKVLLVHPASPGIGSIAVLEGDFMHPVLRCEG